MAPEVGLEPTTTRLTAACSTIELLWNSKSRGESRARLAHRQQVSKTQIHLTAIPSPAATPAQTPPPLLLLRHRAIRNEMDVIHRGSSRIVPRSNRQFERALRPSCSLILLNRSRGYRVSEAEAAIAPLWERRLGWPSDVLSASICGCLRVPSRQTPPSPRGPRRLPAFPIMS